MATITAIRQGLQVRLDTISGVHAYAYESDHPVAPAIMVSTYTADYDLALGGGTTYDFNLYVVLSGNVDRSYQEQIDSYLSPSGSASIAVAVDGDPTLGGVVDFAAVRQVDSSLVQMDFAGVSYAAATCSVEVIDQ
jgi:hypothetical protein